MTAAAPEQPASVGAGPVQSIERAFRILDAMADAGGTTGLSELAGAVDLPLPTIHRLVRTLVAIVAGSVLLSGCDFDVYELPLPGGADVGDDAMTVTVEFENVLDLVPQSSVKVNDVTVGKVKAVDIKERDGADGKLGYVASVEIESRCGRSASASAGRTRQAARRARTARSLQRRIASRPKPSTA